MTLKDEVAELKSQVAILNTEQEKLTLLENQKKCKHYRIALFIDSDGYTGTVVCKDCDKCLTLTCKQNKKEYRAKKLFKCFVK